MECTCGVSRAVAVYMCIRIRMGMCKLCYAFRNSPRTRCSVLELAFSMAEIRNFSKGNCRLSATWNTSLLDLLLVYRAASHSSNCKTIITREMQSINGASIRVLDSLFERIAFKTFE